MPNPILNDLRSVRGSGQPATHNQNRSMIEEFLAFAKTHDPKEAEQIIMQKVNSGEISKDRFEKAKAQAMDFAKLLGAVKNRGG